MSYALRYPSEIFDSPGRSSWCHSHYWGHGHGARLSDLGDSVDVILRENYRSVIACQDMKEALERIDSQAVISLTGNRPLNTGKYLKSFRDALEVEIGNVTMPGEGDLADMIRQKFEEYEAVLAVVTDESRDLNSRTAAYFGQLYPLFSEIKDTAQEILEVNQKNMTDANDAARSKASSVRVHLMAGFIVSGFAAVFFIYLTQRWILCPDQEGHELCRGDKKRKS